MFSGRNERRTPHSHGVSLWAQLLHTGRCSSPVYGRGDTIGLASQPARYGKSKSKKSKKEKPTFLPLAPAVPAPRPCPQPLDTGPSRGGAVVPTRLWGRCRRRHQENRCAVGRRSRTEAANMCVSWTCLPGLERRNRGRLAVLLLERERNSTTHGGVACSRDRQGHLLAHGITKHAKNQQKRGGRACVVVVDGPQTAESQMCGGTLFTPAFVDCHVVSLFLVGFRVVGWDDWARAGAMLRVQSRQP